jgi:hypothetical protein
MIYLDSAAVVKLAHAEAESPALRAWLHGRAETGWVSSVLTEIESFRVLARYPRCGLPAACGAGPDRADRPGPAHPDPGLPNTEQALRHAVERNTECSA